MITSQQAKAWLRNYSRRKRRFLSPAYRKKQSGLIVAELVRSREYKKAKTIAVYLGFGSEVQTAVLVERAWRDKKTVLIPMTMHGLHKPFFCEYAKGDKLKKTRFGMMELARTKGPFPFKKIDLVIVPGLAFDERGHRLGYGGGTYDRILAKTKKAKAMGLFFPSQKIPVLPSERHDCKVISVLANSL